MDLGLHVINCYKGLTTRTKAERLLREVLEKLFISGPKFPCYKVFLDILFREFKRTDINLVLSGGRLGFHAVKWLQFVHIYELEFLGSTDNGFSFIVQRWRVWRLIKSLFFIISEDFDHTPILEITEQEAIDVAWVRKYYILD